MIETKLAIGAAIASALLATAPPTVADPITAWTQLGVAGASMLILFWIVSKRDPKIAEINAAAIKAAADTHAQALKDLVQSQNEMQQRHHELVMNALKATPPRT